MKPMMSDSVIEDRFWRGAFWGYALVFLICVVVFVYTAAPTILVTDSPEFVMAATTLGIPHAPGYPLYTLSAHLITELPFAADHPARALNLYAAVSLAMAAPLLMYSIQAGVGDRFLAASVTLAVMFSYYIWTTGIVAEVYAQQLLMLCATAASIAYAVRQPIPKIWHSLLIGALYGLAVAMAPASILLAPGLAAFFLWWNIPRAQRIGGGLASLLVFGVCLLYFPLAYQADPLVNAAGVYDETGTFLAEDLTTLDGVWWLLRGEQFGDEFFADGWLVTPDRLGETLRLLLANFYGIGFLVALVGVYVLYQKQRALLMIWLALFLPYTYFFMTYGAEDRETMFGPSILLLAPLFGLGAKWLFEDFSAQAAVRLTVLIPALFLLLNFESVNANDATGLYEHVEIVAQQIPPEAVVFGDWADTMPLRYYQVVEDQRTDIEVYTLFFFEYDQARVQAFVDQLLGQGRQVIFLETAGEDLLDMRQYLFREQYFLATGPHNRSIRIVEMVPLP